MGFHYKICIWNLVFTFHHFLQSVFNGSPFRYFPASVMPVVWSRLVNRCPIVHYMQSTLASYRSSSGISPWTFPLRHIHYITGSHHTDNMYFSYSTKSIPMTHCFIYIFISFNFILIWQSNFSCTVLRLSGGLLSMDQRPSPAAHFDTSSTELLVIPATLDSSAQLHHPAWFNYPIQFSQKSWGNLLWQADIQRPHC